MNVTFDHLTHSLDRPFWATTNTSKFAPDFISDTASIILVSDYGQTCVPISARFPVTFLTNSRRPALSIKMLHSGGGVTMLILLRQAVSDKTWLCTPLK